MKKEEATKEEQTPEPSKEEKEEESSEPGSPQEALDQFNKAQAEESKKEESEKPAEETEKKAEEKPSEESAEKKEAEVKGGEEKPEPTLWIVDAEGNKTPAVFKADGKFYAPDTPEKILTYGNFGIHRKSQHDEIEQANSFIKLLTDEYKKGNLVFKGENILPVKEGEEEKKPTEEKPEEDDALTDPELKKRDERIAALEKKDKKRVAEDLKKMLETEEIKLKSAMKESSAKFPSAFIKEPEEMPTEERQMPLEVWKLLSMRNKEDTEPLYSPEEAMEISHKSALKFAKKVVKENPKEFGIDEDAIFAKKLSEKKEREEAPVGSPSESPAAEEAKPDTEEPQTAQEGFESFKKQYKPKTEVAEKS